MCVRYSVSFILPLPISSKLVLILHAALAIDHHKTEGVAVDHAVLRGLVTPLGCDCAGEFNAVRLEKEVDRSLIAIGRRHFGGPFAGEVRGLKKR